MVNKWTAWQNMKQLLKPDPAIFDLLFRFAVSIQAKALHKTSKQEVGLSLMALKRRTGFQFRALKYLMGASPVKTITCDTPTIVKTTI